MTNAASPSYPILHTFARSEDESKYRVWLHAHSSKTTRWRRAMALLSIVFLVENVWVAPLIVSEPTGTASVNPASEVRNIFRRVSTVMVSLLMIGLVALTSDTGLSCGAKRCCCCCCCDAAGALRRGVYILSTLGMTLSPFGNWESGYILSSVFFISLILAVGCNFSFRELIPHYVIGFVVLTANNIVQSRPEILSASTAYIGWVSVLWQREYHLRKAWAEEARRQPRIMEAQRNAAHDVRNALQEVLSIVDSGGSMQRGAADTASSSGGSSSKGNSKMQASAAISIKTAETALAIPSASAAAAAGEEKLSAVATAADELRLNKTTPASPRSTSSSAPGILATTPKHIGTVVTAEEESAIRGSVPSTDSIDRNGHSSTGSTAAATDSTDDRRRPTATFDPDSPTSASSIAPLVRIAIRRITNRLDSSLRDERNVVMDDFSRLTPVVEPCNLANLFREDLILDTQITYLQAANFPMTVETDPAWMRTCLWNLVNNAKKHGPYRGNIQVGLLWISNSSSIRLEVTDQGTGISPARAREIWRGQNSRPGAIGIKAVKSYIDGLGGTYGCNRSTFWVQVPGGLTESHLSMHPWLLRFSSSKAERIFRRQGHKPMNGGAVLTASIVLVAFVSVYVGASGNGFDPTKPEPILNTQGFSAIFSAVIVSFLAWCHTHYSDYPQLHPWFARMLLVFMVIQDILNTFFVCTEWRGAGRGEQKYLIPALYIESLVLICGACLNLPFKSQTGLLHVVLVIDRIIMVVHATTIPGLEGYKCGLARALHIFIVCTVGVVLWYSERQRRVQYRRKHMRGALRRELRILELSASVRAEEAKRDAARNAAHRVAGCFNTLWTAALQIQREVEEHDEEVRERQKIEKEAAAAAASEDNTKEDAKDTTTTTTATIATTTATVFHTRRRQQLNRCFATALAAKEHFILLQQNSRHLSAFGRPIDMETFNVWAVVDKTVSFFKHLSISENEVSEDSDNIWVRKENSSVESFCSSPSYLRQILHEIIYSIQRSGRCKRICIRSAIEKDVSIRGSPRQLGHFCFVCAEKESSETDMESRMMQLLDGSRSNDIVDLEVMLIKGDGGGRGSGSSAGETGFFSMPSAAAASRTSGR